MTANRMHPFAEDDSLPITGEMHDAIIALNGPVAKFLAHAEAHYLLDHLPSGTVTLDEDA